MLVRFHNSCDLPSREISWSFAYWVTAPAMASSRQRFSVRKSSVLMGAASSTARSVDGLTDVTVVVHDLSNGEPPTQHFAAVPERAVGDLTCLRRPVAQFLDQLIQEQGYSVLHLRFGRRWSRSCRHFDSAAADELVAIYADEVIERG